MITHVIGDLLAVKRGVIVHGCNCIGVMGAGIAAQVARKWPRVEKGYQTRCETNSLEELLGTIDVHMLDKVGELFIVNAFTQLHPGIGKQVSYDAVAECFGRISVRTDFTGLPICFPLIGCGLAGGKWPIVSAIIDEQLPQYVDKRLYIL